MILLDQPYVSELLLGAIRERELPVVATPEALSFGVADMPSVLSEAEAVERARATPDPTVYVVSESSYTWIRAHLAGTVLPERIARFKDKARFRSETAALFPGMAHRALTLDELGGFDPSSFPRPFIVKPAVGFLSLGVRRVDAPGDWPAALDAIRGELRAAEGLFDEATLDATRFLVESCVEGREFAVDAYYDAEGEPVVLSVFEHLFASPHETSDRLYVTSAAIVRENLERFTALLQDLGRVHRARDFAVHVELRVDAGGRLWPIEVNPARFGGWCTTADTTARAFGFNPYACFLEQRRPDWSRALKAAGDDVFALVALGNTTGIEGARIASFDHEGLARGFTEVLESRPVDFRRYPIFGFLLTRTPPGSTAELDRILRSDLREFVTPEGDGVDPPEPEQGLRRTRTAP